MSKAEEAALEKFPVKIIKISYQDLINIFGGKGFVDSNSIPRVYFQQGYEQAEKDLTSIAQFSSGPDGFFYGKGYEQAKKDFELTWEDILIIHEKIRAVYDIAIMAEMDSKQIYEEVLRRFKIAKKEKK